MNQAQLRRVLVHALFFFGGERGESMKEREEGELRERELTKAASSLFLFFLVFFSRGRPLPMPYETITARGSIEVVDSNEPRWALDRERRRGRGGG